MQVMLTRLLTLIALVLMPFGMAAAPASAQPMPPMQHHAATAESHCMDQDSPDHGKTAQPGDCAMTCAAIVAPQPAAAPPPARVKPVIARPLVQRGSGLHTEAATPPPKRA